MMVQGVSALSSCCLLTIFCVFLRPESGYMMVQGVTALPSCCFLAVFCVFLRPESGYMMLQGVSALSSCCLLAIFCVFLRPESGHVMVKGVTTYKKEKRNPWIPEVPHIYKIQIISLRTEEHDELPLNRTSFFPSFLDLLLRNQPS